MSQTSTSEPTEANEADFVAVPSPYQGVRLSVWQHVTVSAYWFATNFVWGALLLVMLPNQIRAMDPEYKAPTLGFLTGAAAVVALIVPLIAGALSDRCAAKWGRRRPFMAVGIAVNVIGLAAMAAAYSMTVPSRGARNVWESIFSNSGILLFFVAYLVVQFGNNVATAAYMGVIPDVVPEDQRGIASGYMALMSQAGTLFGAIGSAVLLKHQGEPAKYGLIILVLAGVGMMTLFGMKETPLPTRPPRIDWGVYVKSLWIDPRQYPDFAWVWITRALVMLGFYSVLPFINFYLVDVINVKQELVAEKATYVLGIILISSTISGLLGGTWSEKIGRKKVVYISNMTIAVMALSFIFCRSINDVLIAGSIFGLGYGAYISVDYALGTDVLPSRKDAGKEMAVWHIAMTLPQSIAAPLAGMLIASQGKVELPPLVVGEDPIVHYSVHGYALIFILCAVCFALGAYLLRNVRRVN